MDEESAELIRGVFAAIAAGDLDQLLTLTDPEVEWHSFFSVGESGEYRGHQELGDYLGDLSEAWEELRPVLDDHLRAGDIVIAVGRIEYRGRESGVETTAPAGWMFELKDGKVLRFRAFRDPEQVLRRIGSA
ncbi:MAG: uncharacterized protein QOD60_1217 [Solirubrobacterales bacterium]|jgi:ketosteroid isomerase-like protein|nr:uncharacterized protein [Solirubrobacterales bacterium]